MTRRIVTAQADGKAIFASDGVAPLTRAFSATPGFVQSIIWATGTASAVPIPAGDDATSGLHRLVPAPGETRCMVVTVPPDAVFAHPEWDPVAAAQENAEHLFGLADYFEVEVPGMHRTPTIDYAIITGGEIWLELDDGEARLVDPGDVVVQGGVRHAWRNRSDEPATLVFVMVGAGAIDSRGVASPERDGPGSAGRK